jgi:Protein of unknown function (DUF3892)
MGATYYIRAVHLERAPGATHDHIAAVKVVGSERSIPRSDVEYAIRYGGDVFYTNATPPARVIVRNCPFCYAHDYITTEPDYTVANNLLDLPKY